MIKQNPSETFSDLYHEVYLLCDIWKFEEGEDGKATRKICLKYILMLAEWDDKLRADFKMFQGKDSTEGKCIKAGHF